MSESAFDHHREDSGDMIFKSNRSKDLQEDFSRPKTQEELQAELRQQILEKKQKNEMNLQLTKFRKSLVKQDPQNTIVTSQDKISQLPPSLSHDLKEAVLYAYYAIRYLDEQIYKVILTRVNRFQDDQELHDLFAKERSFKMLTIETSYSRFRLNQIAFEISLEKDYRDVAFHFIETGQVHITWDMITKMIDNSQEKLVKQCIKYGSKFDAGSAGLKKIVFAGRTAAALEDRSIKLVDFIQVMLERKWKTSDIQEVLFKYSKKGRIESQDIREMFVLFAMKRKIKLLSYLINSEDFQMEFQEDNFIDVLENDAFDVGVLLYREFFLQINHKGERICGLMINSFLKNNGMLESKCFLLKRFINKMTYEQANKFLETIEESVFDSSKSNILVLTLNVIRASCLLIELLEKVNSRFNFLSRRVYEIRQKITKIALDYMNQIQFEEEMRFLLLEKDLDGRDALNNIYDYEILDLLENPFAQNIVNQIWNSEYNNSHSLFSVSSIHTLLFNYNHCRYDMEEKMRFYQKRDLQKYGCHAFQFQVWRYSGASRHLVSAITSVIFIIIMHVLISSHMTYSIYVLESRTTIDQIRQHYAIVNNEDNPILTNERVVTNALYEMWGQRLVIFEKQATTIMALMLVSSLFLLQKIFDATFAGKNKRVPHMVNMGNFLDFAMFFIGFIYFMIYIKDWRYDTFLVIRTPVEEAYVYYDNYVTSIFNENAILLVYGVILWLKAFYQLKLISITGSLFAILTRLLYELIIFGLFYFSQLFLYGVVGAILFSDLDDFSKLSTALFTLFRATILDYDIDVMKKARIGAVLGQMYFLSFLIINLVLIVNLIVGQLSYAYKVYRKRRGILFHLSTLSVREVSEADDKYSAIVSAPFPLSALNFLFGAIVLNMKSEVANVILLKFYYLPVAIVAFVSFIAYQYVMLPICYLKVVGHKFALMVKSPQGQGARSTFDRALQGFLFLVFGIPILLLNSIVDIFWFLKHMYMMNLDKSVGQGRKEVQVNRRTYKKMHVYFEQKNEQLVPQQKVAQDLRRELNVMEGLRYMIYGNNLEIADENLDLYIRTAKKLLSKSGKEEEIQEEPAIIENVVHEFETIKNVLLNNSFTVDMTEIQQSAIKKRGQGLRLLFDKKLFYKLLVDMERMRKLINLKKQFFIFHIPYEGKPDDMHSWHLKVEQRMNMTLKFLNTSRLLKIIGYDPVLHIKADNINLAQDILGSSKKFLPLSRHSPAKSVSRFDDFQQNPKLESPLGKGYQNLQKIRTENVNTNLRFMLNKYQSVGTQMKDLVEIIKKLNSSQFLSAMLDKVQGVKEELKVPSGVKSSHYREGSQVYDSQRQKQVNYYSPSKYGVISPPLIGTGQKPQDGAMKKLDIKYSEGSRSEAVIDDEEDEVEGNHAMQDDINTFSKKKKKE